MREKIPVMGVMLFDKDKEDDDDVDEGGEVAEAGETLVLRTRRCCRSATAPWY